MNAIPFGTATVLLVLAFGIASGCGGTNGNVATPKDRLEDLDPDARSNGAAVKIMVASRDLTKGRVLSMQDLATKSIPARHVLTNHVKRADAELLVGKKLLSSVPRHGPILREVVTEP